MGLEAAYGASVIRSPKVGNLMQLYLQYRGQNKAAKAKEADEQWKKTNEVLDYADKFGLDISKFDELNRGLADETNIKLRQGTRQYLQQNPNDFNGAKQYAAKTADELKVKVSEYNAWKATLDDLGKKVQDGYSKGIYNKGAVESVRALYLNPDGSLKANRNPDGTLNDWDIRNSMKDAHRILDNPAIYDEEGTLKSWVGTLDEQATQFITKLSGGPGRTMDEIEQTVKSGLQYMKAPDGSLKIDDDGNPIPVINEFTLKMAMMNPEARTVIDAYGGPTKESKIAYLQDKITPQMDKVAIDRQVIKGNAIPQEDKFYYAYGSGFRTPIADLEARDERLEKIVTNNRPDLLSGLSDPSSDLKAFYANSDGKPLNSGEKPQSIVLVHVGRSEKESGVVDETSLASVLNAMRNSSLDIKPEVYPIGDAEKNRKAKIAMSLRLDKVDSKRAIGEEYSNFVEAKRKNGSASIAEKMKAAAKKK